MEKSNHRILLAFIVIIIIGICGLIGYLILDKSGMNLSGNSTTNLDFDRFNISITSSSIDNPISIDKTNIKVSGTIDDTKNCIGLRAYKSVQEAYEEEKGKLKSDDRLYICGSLYLVSKILALSDKG